MNVQVCHCGWTKCTTYHGLRVHQGKKGCTPKGMRIPESEQFRFSQKVNYLGPQIRVQEPFVDVFKRSVDSVFETPRRSQQTTVSWFNDSRARRVLDFSIHGQQARQEKMKADLQLEREQERERERERQKQLERERERERKQQLERERERERQQQLERERERERQQQLEGEWQQQLERERQQQLARENGSSNWRENGSSNWRENGSSNWRENGRNNWRENGRNNWRENGSSNWRENGSSNWRENDSSNWRENGSSNWKENGSSNWRENDSSNWRENGSSNWRENGSSNWRENGSSNWRGNGRERRLKSYKRQAFELITGTALLEQPQVAMNGTAYLGTSLARQEKMKADLLQKIDIRQHKMAEVRSSVIDCKGILNAEWREINNFFSDMIKVVEDARQKALQPLEDRRWKVKRDEQDVIAKLQREIDVLKKAIHESDKNPDLEVSPLTGLSDSTDCKILCVDTSLSFGTLRAATSAMMKQIQQEIEKLSSIELKRISAFAVDVKLDPATAHQSLVLSDDGKKVRDVGKTAKGPDSPQRFDMFGSVLGLNRLTSGRAYWEVEVSKKTGWDMGVARRDANRKGILSLNPDNGYWVVVHYEDKKYAALTAPPMSLSLKEKPQKVGVFVDYEEGLVSFYDVTSQSHIFSFTECLFGGEILPYFSPHLKQNEKNTDPLIISAVLKHS
ncbi:probable E3 ubiquitin-protein ligase TRIML1 [Archocentrus centrarchus]|uniref:probable E3 ubiquitin-protein ligase TRIML1 n=1 Tax=Archocentrus centrarchus TaxID=63155 RepID=UPI0011EA3E77|nr:probable E3 ubiquitin-protein ligase TRIML1 [Archocentrus centrarchus]